MAALGLFFVGSVLLVNGLGLLGLVGPKPAAPVNAFVGSFLLGIVLLAVLTARGDDAVPAALGVAGFLLFAFTYLYVAIGNWAGNEGTGLGWFCGWAVLVSLMLSAVSFWSNGDARFGAIWVSWAVLFLGFFLVLALGKAHLAKAVGVLTIVESFTTATLPGGLQLLGVWDSTPVALVVTAQVVTVLAFVVLAVAARGSAVTSTSTPVTA